MWCLSRIGFRSIRTRPDLDASPAIFVLLAAQWFTRGSDLMREIQSDPPPSFPATGPTNFPIVPLEDVPAPGLFADAGADRPMVLVVDDEPAIADALSEILNRNGYAAIAAYD